MRTTKSSASDLSRATRRTLACCLAGFALAVAAPDLAAQQRQAADPKAESTEACRNEVRSRVQQAHPQMRDIQIQRGRMEQWQQSDRELAFSGDGRVQVRSGEWKEFRFTCTYNTRHGRITAADVQMAEASSEIPAHTPGGSGSGDWSGGGTGTGSREPERGVTLHRDLQFRGISQTFTSDVRDLRGTQIGDDQATSVSAHGGCRARLHRDPNFRGGFLEVGSDIGDLRRSQVGDDSVSSIEVRCNGGSWSDQGYGSSGGSWETEDSWETGGRAPFGLTLYQDPGFRGVSQTFTNDAGDLWNSRIGNDQATSVRISDECRARLYRDSNFSGNYVEIDEDIPDLRRSPIGDDSISSVQVRCERDQWGDEWGGGTDASTYGVTLHRDLEFRGTSETFTDDVRDLRYSRIGNDQATSVSISWGCRARLYRDPDFRGAYLEIGSDVGDLRGTQVGDDAVSSLQIRCDR